MNEMYSMGIGIHDAGVSLLVAMIVFNMALLLRADDIRVYARRMRILMPLSASAIAVIIFTGAVTMAAKRLDFSLENIIMIIFSVVLIVLEAKRYKSLKRSNPDAPNAFDAYKARAMKLMGIALGGTVLISVWMLL